MTNHSLSYTTYYMTRTRPFVGYGMVCISYGMVCISFQKGRTCERSGATVGCISIWILISICSSVLPVAMLSNWNFYTKRKTQLSPHLTYATKNHNSAFCTWRVDTFVRVIFEKTCGVCRPTDYFVAFSRFDPTLSLYFTKEL